jgi:site-specific recombinase XerD
LNASTAKAFNVVSFSTASIFRARLGIRRTYGSARVRKAPAVAGKMLGMVAAAPDKLAGLRDRALLLVGFGGALRRSELVALDVADLQETETGLLVKIRGSKTDQERARATIAIARGDVACPAKALREWLDAAGMESGPIFRPIDKGGTVRRSRLTDRSVANIVKACAARAGFDASVFSGHPCGPASLHRRRERARQSSR